MPPNKRRHPRRTRGPLTVEDLYQAITGGGPHTLDPARLLYTRVAGRLIPIVAIAAGRVLGEPALIFDAVDVPGEAADDALDGAQS